MLHINFFSDSTLTEVTLLLLAFVLSALIGIEREYYDTRSAGLRTHILVGLGAVVFTLVSIYGFSGMLGPYMTLDPSRIAAGVVAGIGFLGAGVIFVRQNVVNGLTTAASIWVTAAIGMASGAGMVVLAIVATALYLITVIILDVFGRHIRRPHGDQLVTVILYKENQDVLREVLALSTSLGYQTSLTMTNKLETPDKPTTFESHLVFSGRKGSQESLVEQLGEIKGITSVQVTKDDD